MERRGLSWVTKESHACGNTLLIRSSPRSSVADWRQRLGWELGSLKSLPGLLRGVTFEGTWLSRGSSRHCMVPWRRQAFRCLMEDFPICFRQPSWHSWPRRHRSYIWLLWFSRAHFQSCLKQKALQQSRQRLLHQDSWGHRSDGELVAFFFWAFSLHTAKPIRFLREVWHLRDTPQWSIFWWLAWSRRERLEAPQMDLIPYCWPTAWSGRSPWSQNVKVAVAGDVHPMEPTNCRVIEDHVGVAKMVWLVSLLAILPIEESKKLCARHSCEAYRGWGSRAFCSWNLWKLWFHPLWREVSLEFL